MKIQFLLITAIFYRVSAGYSGNFHSYGGAALVNDHVPVIHNGVPVDTPEVQAAKAQHFEAYNRAAILAAKQPSDGQYHERKTQTQYYQNGYQQDTPEVQHAKSLHLAAFSKASYNHGYRFKRGIYNFGSNYQGHFSNSAPEDTQEVQLAKYQHQVAHLVAHEREHNGLEENDGSIKAHQAHTDGYYHIPIIGKDGVPVDTPEVQVARNRHLLAHYYAKSGHQEHQQSYGFSSDHEGAVIGPNGVPFDTLEVQLAKAQHLAVHAEESSKHDQWRLQNQGYGDEGHY